MYLFSVCHIKLHVTFSCNASSSGFSKSQLLVYLQRGYLIPFVLSLDGEFWGCSTVGFSPFLSFGQLAFSLIFICRPCPVRKLVSSSSPIKYRSILPSGASDRLKAMHCRPASFTLYGIKGGCSCHPSRCYLPRPQFLHHRRVKLSLTQLAAHFIAEF